MLKINYFFGYFFGCVGIPLAVLFCLPWAVLAIDYEKETEVFHMVAPGDTLSRIARRYFPLTDAYTVHELIGEIRERNHLEGSLIRPNQPLRIPIVRSTPAGPATIPKVWNFEAKGIYVNRYSAASVKMRQLLDSLVALGGNTIILDGKDMSGKLSYQSAVDLAQATGADAAPTIENLPKLIHALHEEGLHLGVRVVLFYDPLLASKRPELAVRSGTTGDLWRQNGKAAWVDPSSPIVQRYNLDIAKELAESGVDEIQFDYIRFPTMGNTEDAVYGFDDDQMHKHEVITAFLARAREELAPYQVLLSVDVFGVMGWGRPDDLRMTGQKIEALADHCDVISPMIYPSHFYGSFGGIMRPGDQPSFFISETCRRFSALLSDKEVGLRPWIQAFPLGTTRFDKAYILEELYALSESAVHGWLLWSAGNAYDVAWDALAEWRRATQRQRSTKARVSRRNTHRGE